VCKTDLKMIFIFKIWNNNNNKDIWLFVLHMTNHIDESTKTLSET